MQPAQPAVQTGGGSSMFSTTPTRPSNVTLSQQEQGAILAAAGYPGGRIVGGQAIPQPKMGKNAAGSDTLIDTGEYQVSVQDAQGNNVGSITVTKGPIDEGGNQTWGLSDVPKTPTASTQSKNPNDLSVYVKGSGYWFPKDPSKPNENFELVIPDTLPNADDEQKKAVDRQVAEATRNARQRNEAQYGFYGTDAELADFNHMAAQDKLGADTLAQRKTEWNQAHKYDDQNQKIADDKAASDLETAKANRGLTGAQQTSTEATAAATKQATQIAAERLPGQLKQDQATLEGTEASTAATRQSTQIAGAPTVQGPQTGMYTYTRDPKTGAITQTGMNQEYMPKTQAEVAARIGQIQQLQQAKGQEVQGKVGQYIGGKQYTAEDALREYNSWYDAQVAPQAKMLQAAQDEALATQARLDAATRQQSYQQAQAAGRQAADMATTNWGLDFLQRGDAAMASGGGKFPNMEALNNVPLNAPDMQKVAAQGTAEALKYIDPRAAAATGAPPPNLQGLDIGSMIGRDQYAPPGLAAPAPPPQGGGAAPVPNPALGQGANLFPGLSGPQNAMPFFQTGQPGNPFTGLNQGGPNRFDPWNLAPPYTYS